MIKTFPYSFFVVFLLLAANSAIAQFDASLSENSDVGSTELVDSDSNDASTGQIITEQIMKIISTWAGAWQSQLPDPYIAHYTLDYKPESFNSRDDWLADRRVKLTEPEYIKIRLLDFELIALEGDKAITRFKLIYERPDYSDETYKQLVLVNNNGFWLIEQEFNIEVNVL